MRVVLDECVDQRFGRELVGHTVQTVSQLGWSGKTDQEVLRLAEQQFEALITVDRNLPHQQNLSRFRIAVLILHGKSNRLADLKPLVPAVLSALPRAKAGQAMVIS